MSSPWLPCNRESPGKKPGEQDGRDQRREPRPKRNKFLRTAWEPSKAEKIPAENRATASFDSRFFSPIPAILARIQLGGMRRGVVGGMGSSKPKWFPRQLRVTFCELLNLDELVLLHVRETLSRVRGRPPHFQPHNFRRFPQADVLLDGVRAERTTAADRAIYG